MGLSNPFLSKGSNSNSGLVKSGQNPGSVTSNGVASPVPAGVMTPADKGYDSPTIADASAMMESWRQQGLCVPDEMLEQAKEGAKFYTANARKSGQFRRYVESIAKSSKTMVENFNKASISVMRSVLDMHKSNNQKFDAADQISFEYQREGHKRSLNHQYYGSRYGVQKQRLDVSHQKRLSALYGGGSDDD